MIIKNDPNNKDVKKPMNEAVDNTSLNTDNETDLDDSIHTMQDQSTSEEVENDIDDLVHKQPLPNSPGLNEEKDIDDLLHKAT